MRFKFIISPFVSFIILIVEGRETNSSSNGQVTPTPGDFGILIREELFDDFNLEDWEHDITAGSKNNGFQFYNNDRRTSFIMDGKLHLQPMLTSEYLGISDKQLISDGELDLWGETLGIQCTSNFKSGCHRKSNGDDIINPIMSAKLRSYNSFSMNYGKIEIRAKLPKGDWITSSISLVPKLNSYGTWPASGEINILQSRGNQDNCYGDGINTVTSSIFSGFPNNHPHLNLKSKFTLKNNTDFNQDFHNFTLEWTPNYIRTWVDGIHLLNDVTYNKISFSYNDTTEGYDPWLAGSHDAPFDQEFYLTFDVSVGGTDGYYTDGHHYQSQRPASKLCHKIHRNQPKPWSNHSPYAPRDFLKNKDQWFYNWLYPNPKQTALIIDSIKFYEYKFPF